MVTSYPASMEIAKVVADAGAGRANAGLPWNAKTGTNCWLDGSGSYDPDGAVIGYAWTFDVKPSGSALSDADIHGADTASPWFAPDVEGLYTLKLTVLDSEDAAYDQPATVQVSSSASNNVNAVIFPREVNAVVNEPVMLDGSGSAPTGVTYAWISDRSRWRRRMQCSLRSRIRRILRFRSRVSLGGSQWSERKDLKDQRDLRTDRTDGT